VDFLIIVQVLALLSVSILSVFLITVLARLKQVLTSFETDVKELTTRAVPVLDNMESITARVKSITENIDDQVFMVRESIGSMKEITDNVVALERKIQERIEGPLLDSLGFVAAVVKGIRTFFDRVRA
jgi:uncharacterized protein YoxC